MKISIRWWSRFAFIAGVGVTALAACSSDHSDGHGQKESTGTLALALQATSNTGSVYRLHNAIFQITNARSGENVAFLFSDDMPDATELVTTLDRSDYTVTLQPGWFLERVSGSGGSGGGTAGSATGGKSGGFGGTFAGGDAGFPAPASGATPVPSPSAGEVGGDASAGGAPTTGGSFPTAGSFSIGGDAGAGGQPPTEGGVGPSAGSGGTINGGGSGPGGGVVVDAQLISNAVQFFSIFGGDDEFVNYQFKVGGEVIDFNRGKLHIGISVDDTEACQVPSDVTNARRILLESNVDAVSQVSLSMAFQALASNGGHTGDPLALYQQVYDSYASADRALLPGAIHCGDEMTNGVPTLNGFPIDCNRAEAAHVNDIGNFFATAFVNRIDLAPTNGAHCGQQRMIFANRSRGRAFMILEAQIPNPSPELGIDGCLPLAQFWMNQNDNPDAAARGALLSQAFLQGGVKGLAEFGFGAFLTAENLTVGSGQIRTNQFDSFPWTLREFKLALAGDALTAVPFPVAEAPNGALWNENSGLSQGDACRQSFLSALDGVLSDNLATMSFVVDAACKDAESRNDFSEDYAGQLSQGFRSQLQDKLKSLGSQLTPDDVANRARFAGSCIGCHNEASSSALGAGLFAPFSLDFPQVLESESQCKDGETGQCFITSNALDTVFLPGRLQVMSNLLGVPIIPNPCNGGGGGGGFGGSSGFGGGATGGTFGRAGSGSRAGAASGGFATGGDAIGGGMAPPPRAAPQAAPVVIIDLPSADEPVDQLQEEDQEIRRDYGDVTISGKSAKSTH